MLRRLNYQYKLFTYYSVVVFAAILIITVVIYVYLSHLLLDNARKSMGQTAERISSGLESLVKQMDVASTQVLYSEDLQNIMARAGDSGSQSGANFFNDTMTSKAAMKILVSIASPKFTVGRVGIYNDQNAAISAGLHGADEGAFAVNRSQTDYVDDVERSESDTNIVPPHPDPWLREDKSEPVVSFIRSMVATFGGFNKLGYIEVQQPYEMVAAICESDEASPIRVTVLDRRRAVVYPVAEGAGGPGDYTALIDRTDTLTEVRMDDRKTLVFAKYSPYTQWTVFVSEPKSYFLSPILFLQKILVTTSLLFILFSLAVMFLISQKLTAPIREMRKLLKSLSLERPTLQLSKSTNNEMMLFNEAFNLTLTRLQETMHQMIQAKESEARAHMLALQAQINPHFLHNTLMGISGKALEIGSPAIVRMCVQLSDMLRYGADYERKTATIADELKYTDNYLQLMKSRYLEYLIYDIDVDPRLEGIPLPKLIIQPIVENCFSHAFQHCMPPYEVRIRGYIDNSFWYIVVTDNGAGFAEAELQRIRERLRNYGESGSGDEALDTLRIGGLGLTSIYLRMNLFYKGRFHFSVENRTEGGAKITLGGYGDDQSDGCRR